MLSPRTHSWNKQYGTAQHFVAAGHSLSQISKRRFSRDPGLTELPLRLPAFFFFAVHHYVQAASLTGPVMHCAIWGLRHKLTRNKHRTIGVCVLGPARARFGSIAWPSDNTLEVGRMNKAQSSPSLDRICYISPLICSHMIAAGRSLSRDPPCRVEV